MTEPADDELQDAHQEPELQSEFQSAAIVERDVPAAGIRDVVELVHPQREKTRFWLALGPLAVTTFLAIGAGGALWVGRIHAADLPQVALLFSPFVALASVAYGFYFARDKTS